MNDGPARQGLPGAAAVALVAVALASGALLAIGPGDYPALHTVLDTSLAWMLGLSALLLWDMGQRAGISFPKCLGITLGATFVLATIHALVIVEWSGPLAVIAHSRGVLRPATWPPATHLMPIGIGWALWRMRRGVTGGMFSYALGIIVLGAGLFAVFQYLPTYLPPGPLGITRPALVLGPVLWVCVGIAAWRFRALDRLMRPLTWMAGTLFLANTVMLYSRAPADGPAMVAHLGRVGGYLVLLLSTMQMASRDLIERMRAESALARLNEDLDRRVAEQTAELRETTAQLTDALAQRNSTLRDLVRTEEEFRVSFEASTVGKLQVDLETGCIIRANRAFAHMLGYEAKDLIGRNGWEFTWPEDRVSDKVGYTRVFDGNADAHVREKRYLRKDGTPIWGRVSATRVRFPESERPDIVIAVIEDIEERHAAQASLEAATRDLERVVEERTAALAQRNLLLREVYHRVKNNLQIVDSMLVMQSRQLADPEAKSGLLGLRSRVFALGLVHHQLMGSKNLKTFDVSPFLHELSGNLARGGPGQDVAVSVNSIPMDVGLDFAIPLGLLVTELVTNSIKHAFPGGKGNIEVALTRLADGSVALTVSDDGRGYSPDGEASVPRTSGLGTKIIAGLVAQMEGTMTTRNDKGTHTEVRIAAPVMT